MRYANDEIILVARLATGTKAGLVVGQVALEGVGVGWEGEVLAESNTTVSEVCSAGSQTLSRTLNLSSGQHSGR